MVELQSKERFSHFRVSDEKLQYAIKEALKVIDKGIEFFGDLFPSEFSTNNMYEAWENDKGWGQGFWPGIIWTAYVLTDDEKYKEAATRLVPSFGKRIYEKIGVNHHDMGFLYIPSCVAAYKLTGNEEAKKYAIAAADHLISRYQPKGGFIQAWGDVGDADSYRLIIDCLLNIPLLYWASEVTGDPKYGEIAWNHFKATAANNVREDGTTFHTFYFDPETGLPREGKTHQGAFDDSCWARGQAWGVYGFLLTYIYKHNEDAIPVFENCANCFLNKLPADYVPYWDMVFDENSGEEKDSSASAIAGCGLLEGALGLDDNDPLKDIYISAAHRMLESMIDNYITAGTDANGLLLHQVYAKPQGIGVDELNIWGDYFYMELLARVINGDTFHGFW